jgi:hypothetical protein
MNAPALKQSPWLRTSAVVAILFGVLTIIAGGRTLFNAAAQQQAGNYVPFVLWFNFLAGFAYVIAGIGLWLRQRWSIWLAAAIAAATLLVFAAFGLQIWAGGTYEMRTVGAMGLRAVVWLLIVAVAYGKLAHHQHQIAA